jgi:DNA-binding protein H-NS
MKIISASIDLSKLDKSKIQKTDKDGKPYKNNAQYYNIDIIIKDDKDQYGKDVSITTAQSKEEREAKATKVYIGNGKTVWEGQGKTSTPAPAPSTSPVEDDLNMLPF